MDKKKNGAFRSCLIPYKEQIFTWWFDEKKTAREIQALLLENFQIEVHFSTITRFIKVRTRKADPHERPAIQKTQTEKLPAKNEEIPETPLTIDDLNEEQHDTEWYFRKLANTNRKDFGRITAEHEARKRKR